jgi:aspartate-semialdehyde dehydrogenase
MAVTNTRVAIVGASSLRGKELVDALGDSALAASDFVLLDDAETIGQLEAVGEEAAVVLRIDSDAFEGVDYAFFAGTQEMTRQYWQDAHRAGASIIDMTAALDGEPGVVVAAPWVSDVIGANAPVPDLKTTAIVPAHPAAVTLGLLMGRLQKALPVRSFWATVLEPASEQGRAGMDELHQQTVNLLSFHGLPKAVFGLQVAFNLTSVFGDEAMANLAATTERIRSHYAALAQNRLPRLSLQVVQAPVFHGHAFSIAVELEQSATQEQIEKALSGEHVDVMVGDQQPSNLVAAGQADIPVQVRLDGDEKQSARFWIWAAADNLKLAAENAIACAGELAKVRPSGKVQ